MLIRHFPLHAHILLGLLICIPGLTEANEGADIINALHAIKQDMDKFVLTEDGMYKVSLSKDHLAIIAGTGAGALKPLRNWQEYLLDTSDGKSLSKKLSYLFVHEVDFGLGIRHLTKGLFYTKDPLIREGGYAIVLRRNFLYSETSLFIGKNGDFMDVIRAYPRFITTANYIAISPTIMTAVKPLRPSSSSLNDVHDTGALRMNRISLDDTIESRRKLIEAVAARTNYPHVALPEEYARNARGKIVQKPRSGGSLRRFLTRTPKMLSAITIGAALYSLLFANDAESITSEEASKVKITPEEFQQINENIDLALDSYYNLQ